jgi:hypothetical protein
VLFRSFRGAAPIALALSTLALLVACGGGGNDGDGGSRSRAPAENTNPGGPGGNSDPTDGGTATPEPIPTTNYWKMDEYLYPSNSALNPAPVSFTSIDGIPYTTKQLYSLDHTSLSLGNGAYSGNRIDITFNSTEPGTYTIVADQGAFLTTPAFTPVAYIENIIGSVSVALGQTTGQSIYRANSGKIVITRGSDGKLHVSTEGAVPMSKKFDDKGGVPGAPETMHLEMHDAY